MLQFLVTIVAVALPTYLYMRAVRGVDRYEQEPMRYLVAAFLWGAVPAVVLGIILELIFGLPVALVLGEESLASQVVGMAVVAPVVEEIIKAGAVAIIYLWRRREFDGWVDGLVYGAMAGFGFAYVENIFYIAGTESWGDWVELYFLRLIVFGLMHGFWTSLTGIGFGVARHTHGGAKKALAVLVGLSFAILSHMVHNGALVLAESTEGGSVPFAFLNYVVLLILLVVLRIIAGRNERAMFKTYLVDEVPAVISPDAYAALIDRKKSALAALRLTTVERRDFVQAAAELAQKKRQLIRMGNETGNAAEIERLRAQFVALGK